MDVLELDAVCCSLAVQSPGSDTMQQASAIQHSEKVTREASKHASNRTRRRAGGAHDLSSRGYLVAGLQPASLPSRTFHVNPHGKHVLRNLLADLENAVLVWAENKTAQ